VARRARGRDRRHVRDGPTAIPAEQLPLSGHPVLRLAVVVELALVVEFGLLDADGPNAKGFGAPASSSRCARDSITRQAPATRGPRGDQLTEVADVGSEQAPSPGSVPAADRGPLSRARA